MFYTEDVYIAIFMITLLLIIMINIMKFKFIILKTIKQSVFKYFSIFMILLIITSKKCLRFKMK